MRNKWDPENSTFTRRRLGIGASGQRDGLHHATNLMGNESRLAAIAFTRTCRAEGGHMWIQNIVHEACPICGKETTL